LQFWDFHNLNVDDAWNLLLWVAWDSFEFDKACCVCRYYFSDPCAFYARSYYAPLWCDMCNTSSHNVSTCPYYAFYAHSDSSLPLAQCTGLEGVQSFGHGANLGMDDAFCGLEETLVREHDLVNTPLEGCHNSYAHEGSPGLTCENVIPNSHEPYHVSTFSSPPSSSSPEYTYDVPNNISEINECNVDMGHEDHMLNMLGGNVENFESLGSLCGYDATLDLYCVDLVDLPRKIVWHTFFNFSFDFSMAFTLR